MIKYLTQMEFVYAPKNRLEEHIIKFLQTEKRQIIPSDKLKYYQERITAELNKINEQYPRCKPIRIDWWSLHNDDTPEQFHSWRLSLNHHSICTFAMHAGEEVYL